MESKTIQITNADGTPLAGAHVVPDNGTPVISDANGFATVQVADASTFVTISDVSGTTQTIAFFALPEVVVLGRNEMPAVVVTAKKKTNWWIWGGLTAAILLMVTANPTPKKITL